MVIGIGTGLVALGLALPTGLAFGYGYGYGVRQGYSAFRPPGATAAGLKASPDPIKGSLGMGLQTAEERTNSLNLGRPSLQSAEPVISNTVSASAARRQSLSSQQKSYEADRKRERLRLYRAPKFKSDRNRFGSTTTYRKAEDRSIRPWWER